MPDKLKCKKETVIVVDYGDLDNFISKVYDVDFEVVADQELMNDVDKKISVKKSVLNKWEQQDLDDFKSGKIKTFMLYTLMTDLANRDLIEEGNYLIEISW